MLASFCGEVGTGAYEASTMSLPHGEIDLRLVLSGSGEGYIALTVLSTSKVMCLPHVCDESMAIRQSRNVVQNRKI